MPHTKAALANKFDEWESYLGALKLPAWNELPTLELYMDQVVIVLNDYLGMYAAGEDKTVTQAMINNYVKQKLIPPPVKKKYSRVHLALLMIICPEALLHGYKPVIKPPYGIAVPIRQHFLNN